MAEKQCNLLKNGGGMKVLSFPVNGIDIDTLWANGWYYGIMYADTGIDLTNKKVFATPLLSAACTMSIKLKQGSTTTLQVEFYRASTVQNVSGNVSVLIMD